MKKTSRREFIATTGVAAAGLAMNTSSLTAGSYKRILGANNKVRLGFIGVGNHGSLLLRTFMQHSDCEVAALCDVYEPYLNRVRSGVDKKFLNIQGRPIPLLDEVFTNKVDLYRDYRKLLEDKTINAVVIATPDHWHALQCIDACTAGKDVYVEKPLSMTVREGKAMVDARNKNGRMVQVGLNRRGTAVYQRLAKEIPQGKIGKVIVGRAARRSNMYPNGIGKMKPEPPPAGLDWDMWLGPRSYRPYQYNIAPYNFRWWSDYSSQMGNWGVHYMDVIRWLMGEEYPEYITAHGDKYVLDHDADIPDTMHVTFEFASKKIITFAIYETTGSNQFFPYGEIELQGTKGNIFVQRNGYRIFPSRPGQMQTWDKMIEEEEYSFNDESGPAQLSRNFLDCIKNRHLSLLSPVEEGHISTCYSHFANISLKTGKRLHWDPGKEEFTNCREANDLLHYGYREPWKISGL